MDFSTARGIICSDSSPYFLATYRYQIFKGLRSDPEISTISTSSSYIKIQNDL
ncbi:MAG: hypothetical protein ABJ327_05490 [Litoreibacter sp.]